MFAARCGVENFSAVRLQGMWIRLEVAPLYIQAVQTIEGGTLTTPSQKILQMAAVLSAMGSAQATRPRWACGSSRFDV
jgi:hypothetical protein